MRATGSKNWRTEMPTGNAHNKWSYKKRSGHRSTHDILERINREISSESSKKQTEKVIKDIDDFRTELADS